MENGKIDVHAHVFPPSWRAECRRRGQGFPEWTAEAHLRQMDALGIRKSILSITAPGTHLDPGDDVLAKSLARDANLFMAKVAREHPERFGFFASLPLPNCEAAIEEAIFALDQLNADGVGLLGNNHGVYLGDSKFDPLFEKLNDLHAKVFLHPNTCRYQFHNGQYQEAAEPIPGFPGSILEYMFDTTRAVTNLFVSGTVTRYPQITYIVPHCGACLPSVIDRATEFASKALGMPNALSAASARSLLQSRFYFDLAGFPCSGQLPALLRLTTPSRLLYGSDLPFTPENVAHELVVRLDKDLSKQFGEEVLQEIYSGNSIELLEKS